MLKRGFLNPQSIAVIGASSHHHKIGFSVLKNVLDGGFDGQIFPINPVAKEILGLKCYPSVLNISKKIDLAVIVVPANIVPDVLVECGKKQIDCAIIISAGFGELGIEGLERQKRLEVISSLYNIDILGPNCLGYICPEHKLNISFATNMPKKKDIGVVSQSGATCTAILDWANLNGIGFSQFVSLGNKIDLDECDFIDELKNDAKTKVILTYLESITDGPRFIETLKEAVKIKPVVVLKSGKTKGGQTAASSHTGALATDGAVVETALKESGAITAETLEDFFDYANVFSNLENLENDEVLILTNAGGPGVMAADSLSLAKKLNFYQINSKEEKILDKKLENVCKIQNPLDLLGDATSSRFKVALENFRDKVFKLVILTPQVNTDIKNICHELVKNKDNKTVVVFLGGTKFIEAKEILAKHEIPYFDFPERAINALDVFVKYHKNLARKEIKETRVKGFKKAAEKIIKNKNCFDDSDVAKIFAAYNIPMAESYLTTSANEAMEIAGKIKFPIALKVTSPDILHKTEYGAVKLNIADENELRKSYQEVLKNAKKHFPKAKILGVTVYKMYQTEVEVAIGAKRDPIFGPVIMFGLGGIYNELLKDFSLGLAPISIEKAHKMIEEIKGNKLLKGYRGGEIYDVEAIATAISGLSSLMLDFPEVKEIDINPLNVSKTGYGVMALDGKIILDEAKITV